MVATRRSLRLSLGGTESTASASPPPRRASRGKAAAATDATKEAEAVKSEAKATKKTAKKAADDVAPKARATRGKRVTRTSLSKFDIDALAQVAQEVAAKEAAEENAAKEGASARASIEVIDIVSEDDATIEAKPEAHDEAATVNVSAKDEASAEEEEVSAQDDDVSAEEADSAEDIAVDGTESAEEADVEVESIQDVVVEMSAEEATADETTADESMGDEADTAEEAAEAAAQEDVAEEASAVEDEEHIAMAPASDDDDDAEEEEEHVAMAPLAADDAAPDADMEEDDDDDLSALVGMAMASFQAPPPTTAATAATSEAPLALVSSTLESGVSYDNLYMKFNGRKCSRGAELVPERKLTEEVSQLQKQAAYKAKMDAANSSAHEKKVSQDRVQTSRKWFNMTSNEMTAEAKRDIQLIKLRNYLDPKRFYKSSDHKKGNLPKVFQVGTVIEGAAEYKSNRLSRKERQQTFTEEIMHDQAIRSYTKRKFNDIQAARANTSKHKKPFKKAKHYK